MWQDLINSGFESMGGFFILLHILKLLKDKKVRGVSVIAAMFFATWGLVWNIYYYAHLHQWASLFAGGAIGVMNTIYVVLILYYIRKEKRND